MSRQPLMRKIATCPCGLEFFTSKNETLCPPCQRSSQPAEFGIRFYGLVGTPTPAFWDAWRRDKDKLRDKGFRVEKLHGEVDRAETGTPPQTTNESPLLNGGTKWQEKNVVSETVTPATHMNTEGAGKTTSADR